MKRAVIVHCWSGYPEYCWYPQTKKELEALGFSVEVPAMPETDEPKIIQWLPKLQKATDTPDENLYLVGHSIGTVTIMRYLETLAPGVQIGGAVLVAGYTDDLGFPELKNFFQTPLNFEKIKSAAKHFTLIHSDNDPYVDLKYGEILKNKLGANLIVKHNMGHFSGAQDPEDGPVVCTSLPEVAEAITKIA